MYKMCHYEAAMDKIGEDIPWIEDEQNLPVRTYGGYPECHQFSMFSYFRGSGILGYNIIMQMRPEVSRLCLFTPVTCTRAAQNLQI